MEAQRIEPGSDLHLTLLMHPHSLNLVVGDDRATILAFARDVWAAALHPLQSIASLEAPRIWYMRDNHTFRSLPLDVEGAVLVLRQEFDDGQSYGMLCSKHPNLAEKVFAGALAEWPTFEAEARRWLACAVALVTPNAQVNSAGVASPVSEANEG